MADIFQAMVQNRPYRAGLTEGAVRAYLDKLTLCGLVDGEVVQVLETNMGRAMRLAGAGRVETAGRAP